MLLKKCPTTTSRLSGRSTPRSVSRTELCSNLYECASQFVWKQVIPSILTETLGHGQAKLIPVLESRAEAAVVITGGLVAGEPPSDFPD